MKFDNDLLNRAAKKAADKLNIENPVSEPFSVIRLWRALYVKLGGDLELMLHWMNTENTHLGYKPADYVNTDSEKLSEMIDYLEFEL